MRTRPLLAFVLLLAMGCVADGMKSLFGSGSGDAALNAKITAAIGHPPVEPLTVVIYAGVGVGVLVALLLLRRWLYTQKGA